MGGFVIKTWKRYPYTLAPTKEPKYPCKVEFNFQTDSENVWGFSKRTEQPFYRTRINNITLLHNMYCSNVIGSNDVM